MNSDPDCRTQEKKFDPEFRTRGPGSQTLPYSWLVGTGINGFFESGSGRNRYRYILAYIFLFAYYKIISTFKSIV